ncbi:MAG TPA: zinc-binding dehydrogenase, partial [Pyrinomonadaceae bacterium]|nr:zinc-binding dehydrogenase [Pyrinomonadaceae bacterium]
AVLTGVGAVVNTARVPAGSAVAVVGLGGVGLNSLLGAGLVGARQIIAVDVHDEKLDLARRLGATTVVNAREDGAAARVKDLTEGGVDFAFEMAGSVRALDLAYRMTRRGGTTVTAGLPPPDQAWPAPAVNLVAEERTVRGSYVGSSVPLRDVPRYIELYQRGKLPIDKLMGKTLQPSEINSAFDRLASGLVARQVIIL